MAVTLKQMEDIPASYPVMELYAHRNTGNFALMEEDAVIDPALIWQRIEAWTSHRWTPRSVVWTVEGHGEWDPPLIPATITLVEVWEMGAWSEITLNPSPYGGYEFMGDGPYRITATVGGGDVPEVVQEAFRRLHEYSRGIAEQWRGDAAYRQSGDTEMVTNWTAKALQLSGAADLLRPYRRA